MIIVPVKKGGVTTTQCNDVVIKLKQGQKYLTVLFVHTDGSFEVRSDQSQGLEGVLSEFMSAKKPEFLKGKNYRAILRSLANGVLQ